MLASGDSGGKKYDPVKAHEYYERTKKLKGRKKGSGAQKSSGSKRKLSAQELKTQKAKARIGRLREKLNRLKDALSKTEAELSSRRQAAKKEEKKNSDGKTTAKERQDSKEYRDKHKQEIANDRKKESKESAPDPSGPKGLSDMSVEELDARITKLRATVKEAQRQLSNASQSLGQLTHSALVSQSNVHGLYAQFKSAERIPSK